MEIAGPWSFGVAMFTVILLAAGPLNRITSYLAGGASPEVVGQLVALFLPALLVKTFSMAMLLAGLLGFGRLSSDSEITALKAGGASVPRILMPVMAASLLVSLVTFWFNDAVVPRAQRTALELGDRLARSGKVAGQPVSKAVVEKGKVKAFLNAKNADYATQTLQGVAVTVFDERERPVAQLLAPNVRFKGVDDWAIVGAARIVPLDADVNPREVVRLSDGAWPKGVVPQPKGTLADLLAKDDDYDSYTIAGLRAKIAQLRQDRSETEKKIRDFEYGYYNKFSVAFAALVFGTLGAVLGIQNRRSGTASGFALAVGIIFGYVMLANFMNVWAGSGLLPPWAASFAPLCIGAVACGVIIYRRNS